MNQDQIPTAFYAVMELGGALGVKNINALPGCWEQRIDEHWEISVNGHRTPTKCSHGNSVPPFSVYIWFNGFPAGILDAGGGVMAAGAAANEDAFIAAIRVKIGAEKEE